MNAQNQIIAWLKNHDLIKINALEERCGIPQACINKVIKGKIELPEKHVPALLKELRVYGLKLQANRGPFGKITNK